MAQSSSATFDTPTVPKRGRFRVLFACRARSPCVERQPLARSGLIIVVEQVATLGPCLVRAPFDGAVRDLRGPIASRARAPGLLVRSATGSARAAGPGPGFHTARWGATPGVVAHRSSSGPVRCGAAWFT